MIPLVKDTICKNDIKDLIKWLKTNPQLTKGPQTVAFEEEWAKWLGVKYSVMVNSGSSANLAMIYSLLMSGKLKNNKIVGPKVSWVTTISPLMQLGLIPILCECDNQTLGIDVDHFEQICKDENPAALILVHVLGFPCNMSKIMEICEKYGVILLEDTCESVGSRYHNKKVGTFGTMSSFSFYFGHHASTIEGGMVCTNDENLYNILKQVRSHGWSRDLNDDRKEELRQQYHIDPFRDVYTFYLPGFNLRSTDLQAHIGLSQMKKIDKICEKREKNFQLYDKLIKNKYWKIPNDANTFISNFAYPIITLKINTLVEVLKENNIETRPLICGNIENHPFWTDRNACTPGKSPPEFADIIHFYGCYLPNNYYITKKEIEFICKIVNGVIK